MSAYLEKQKLLDWLDDRKLAHENFDAVVELIYMINSGIFDWQPND